MCPTAIFGSKTPTYVAPEVTPAKTSTQTQADAETRRVQNKGNQDQIAATSGGLGDVSRPRALGVALGGSY